MRVDEAAGSVVFLFCAILLARITYNILRDPSNRIQIPFPALNGDYSFVRAIKGLSNIAMGMVIGTALFSASIDIAEEACRIIRIKTSLALLGGSNIIDGFTLAIAYTIAVLTIRGIASFLSLIGSSLSPRVNNSAIPLVASLAAYVFICLPRLKQGGSTTLVGPGYIIMFVCLLLSSLVVGRFDEIMNKKWLKRENLRQ